MWDVAYLESPHGKSPKIKYPGQALGAQKPACEINVTIFESIPSS